MNKINTPDINDKIQHKLHEVEIQMGQQDQFNRYILETLNSFGYRYFEDAKPSECLTPFEMRIVAIEKGIKEAIKIKNAQLRAGIGELVKRVSKEEGPTILRELRVKVLERIAGSGGVCQVSARLSFGHPEHDFRVGSFIEKMSELKFEDDIHFRNNLAKHLEKVCELFE